MKLTDGQKQFLTRLRAVAESRGVIVNDCGNGHFQIRGTHLVHYYPFSKRRTAYVAGQATAKSGVTTDAAVAMAGPPVAAPSVTAPQAAVTTAVDCPYCTLPARLVTGAVLYPHRPDLVAKHFYKCGPCDAWVGCHPGTTRPLGRLANAKLRALKKAVHAAFDPLWQRSGGSLQRSEAYARLAEAMSIPPAECHVGMFDEARCELALRVIAEQTMPLEMRA